MKSLWRRTLKHRKERIFFASPSHVFKFFSLARPFPVVLRWVFHCRGMQVEAIDSVVPEIECEDEEECTAEEELSFYESYMRSRSGW